MVNNTNAERIETYFKDNACESVYNYKTRYKAVCSNKVVVINDYFNIDFSSNEEILFKEIVTIKSDKKAILVQSDTKELTLSFETQDDAKNFEQTLKNALTKTMEK